MDNKIIYIIIIAVAIIAVASIFAYSMINTPHEKVIVNNTTGNNTNNTTGVNTTVEHINSDDSAKHINSDNGAKHSNEESSNDKPQRAYKEGALEARQAAADKGEYRQYDWDSNPNNPYATGNIPYQLQKAD